MLAARALAEIKSFRLGLRRQGGMEWAMMAGFRIRLRNRQGIFLRGLGKD